MARLIKRLIAAETAPGGPYRNAHGEPDLLTNIAVGYLFVYLHIPLPGVTLFINARRAGKQSREVTELLRKYDAALLLRQPFQKTSTPLADTVFSTVTAQITQFDEPLRSLALQFLQRIKKADTHFEIPLFASHFSSTLAATPSNLPLTLLGEANVYCWMAYTIYDHLLDEQSGVEGLPVANCAHRLALTRYHSLFPSDHPFSKLVTSTFDDMDIANSWELANCQFIQDGNSIIIPSLPRYHRFQGLARRSFGHALGPMALTYLCHQTAPSRHLIEKGIRHYLIARQLTDDIYDWQEDIRKGSGSAVVTYILRHARIRPGTYEINSLVAHMQEDFWLYSMEATNTLIKEHIQLSRKYLLKSGCFLPHGPLFDLLERLTSTANQSVRTHADYKQFISTYRKSS